jgi:hypothetical protein
MKKIFFLSAFALSVVSLQAQKMLESEVPAAVKSTFQKAYPGAKSVIWGREAGNYEAEFKENNLDEAAVYDATGKLIQSEKQIDVTALPKAVTDKLATMVPGKTIKEASEIKNADGTVNYEADVNGMEYTFDASGKLLKKERS